MAVLTVPMEQMSATVRIEKFIHLTVLKGFSVNPISLFAMVGDVLTCHQGAMVAPIVLMGAMSATVHHLKLSPTTPKRFSVDSMSLFVMVAGASTRPENVMVTATVLTERMSTTARTEKFQALTTLTACSVPLSNLFAISGDVLTSR